MDVDGRRKQARYRVSFTLLAPPLNIGRPPDNDLLRGDVVSRITYIDGASQNAARAVTGSPGTVFRQVLLLVGRSCVTDWIPSPPLLTDEPISTPDFNVPPCHSGISTPSHTHVT